MRKMTESMPMMSDDGLNPGELREQIDGFPVHTIDYQNGEVLQEKTLDSVTEQDLDSELFTAPGACGIAWPVSRGVIVSTIVLTVFEASNRTL